MDIVDEIIGGVLGVESSEGGSAINYGRYVFLVEGIKFVKGAAGPMFIPELYVEQSQGVNEIDGKTNQVAIPNAVGSSVGYPCNMIKKPAAANARAFVLAVLQKVENKNDPALTQLLAEKMRQWSQPGQPLRGLALVATTWKHTIKSGPNAGQTFPRVKFQIVPGQSKETVLANRAKLDALAQGKMTVQAHQVAAQPAPTYSNAAPTVSYPAPLPPMPVAPPAPQYAAPPAAPQPPPPPAQPAGGGDPFAGLF